jgi:hypothetical protein
LIDAVVTHHTDGYRSGVARFNELLAERLGVPVVGFDELDSPSTPLLSFKVSELGDGDAARIAAALDRGAWDAWDVFLHEFAGDALERRLVEGARRVHCGNLEIEARITAFGVQNDTLWSPGLVLDDREFRASEISVFSFGMAHKVRPDMFGRLKGLLDASRRSYAVYVSAANHENASLKDSAIVFEEMKEIFPDTLYFLGNLSDVAVANYLRRSTFFAAFFDGGVRANNSSVASAMERGAVTITNLDEYSPPDLEHMRNVIDIHRCDELPSDPAVLERIGTRAAESARALTWDALVERIRDA